MTSLSDDEIQDGVNAAFEILGSAMRRNSFKGAVRQRMRTMLEGEDDARTRAEGSKSEIRRASRPLIQDIQRRFGGSE